MSAIASSYRTLPTVLLVEDSQTSTAIISRCLQNEYELVCVKDGVEAWDILCRYTDIELVITDIQMPRLNGHELLMKIRASHTQRIKDLPVIVMTTTDNPADWQLAYNHGASDFVTKPLNRLELLTRIRAHQQLSRTIRELQANYLKLAEQTTVDSLTGLKNRRAMEDAGHRHMAIAQRYHHDLAVVVFDIDHFKKVNETHSPAIGDRVLVNVAQVLAQSIRVGDTAARLGGEEFAILLPNTSQAGAILMAERIRLAVANNPGTASGRVINVTVSAGVACYSLDEPEKFEQLVEVADYRLYQAKQQGRNRVVASTD